MIFDTGHSGETHDRQNQLANEKSKHNHATSSGRSNDQNDLRGSWRLEVMVAPSATSESLSEVHSRFISLARVASPDSVSSSRPVYQSASCEVRPSYYIPLDRLRGVYTIQASSGTHTHCARTRRCERGVLFISFSLSLSPSLTR